MAGLFVPQMVTPIDTSPLGRIGQRIGQWRQDAAIADVMRDLDPADPNSLNRVAADLYARGDRASREQADRLLGTVQTVQRERNIVSERGALRGEREAERRRLEARQRFGAGLLTPSPDPDEPGLGDIPPTVPPRSAPVAPAPEPGPAPAVPARPPMAPAPIIAPTVPSAPAAAAAPLTRTAALGPLPGSAGASDAIPVGGVPATADPRGTPQEQAANAARIAAGQQPVPPASRAAVAALPPAGAPAPVAAPAVPAAPVAAPARVAQAAPTEAPSGYLPPAGIPAAADPGLTRRELWLKREINRLRIGRSGADPDQYPAIDAQINDYKAERAAIREAQEAPLREAQALEKEAQKEANKLETKERFEMLTSYHKEAAEANELRDVTDGMVAIANHPNYHGGPLGGTIQALGGMALQFQKLAQQTKMELPGGVDNFITNYIGDAAVRLRTMQSFANEAVLKKLGGTLGSHVSNTDRQYVHQIVANRDDSKESVLVLGAVAQELARKTNERAALATRLAKRGMNATDIKEELRKWGQSQHSFKNADGTLTELGRTISPQKLKIEDDKLRADLARREAIEGPGKAREVAADAAARAAGTDIPGGRATPRGPADRPTQTIEGRPPRPIRPLEETLPAAAGRAAEAVRGAAGRAGEAVRSRLQQVAEEAVAPLAGQPPPPIRPGVTLPHQALQEAFGPPGALPAQTRRAAEAVVGPPEGTVANTRDVLSRIFGGAEVPALPAATARAAPPAFTSSSRPMPQPQVVPVAPPVAPAPVSPRGYRGPGAPLPLEPVYRGPGAPLPPAPPVARPSLGERFDEFIRGRVNAPAPEAAPESAASTFFRRYRPEDFARARGRVAPVSSDAEGRIVIVPLPPPPRRKSKEEKEEKRK